ncbi:MAG: NADH-quinone oxidoreductase subunit NuoN [Proteobacteria bacterium]|nr:NADH-quinone oxidoreductase subunit NuoN [Pseudomonadota bacterium]
MNVLAPELIVALSGMLLLLGGVLRGDRATSLVTLLASLVMVAAAFVMLTYGVGRQVAFGGAFIVDDFARFAKVLILLGSIVTLAMSHGYLEQEKIARFEFPVLVLFATVGMMLMVSAGGFIGLYMGIELQSLALYVLAAFHRDNARSTEAGLKYFVLGALSSGMLLYGISMIYGFAGTVSFAGVADVVKTSGVHIGLVFGIVFLIAGLAFKVSAVPFHMWTPDVYEGSPTPITAFFSMAPKIAAMALFLRVMLSAFPAAASEWQQVIIAVSLASMVLGAFAAIGQTNIKRLMAYSSIGHMGFALLGLAANSVQGVQGVLIYLTIYLITNAGVFVCILAMKRNGEQVETIDDLAGLSRTQPALAFAFSALMLSLAGVPPMAGFFAKFYVFLAAMQAGLVWLAVLGVLASVVGAYYYLRIVKIIYFDDPAPAFDGELGTRLNAILAAATVFTVLFMVWPHSLVDIAATASKSLIP